MKVSDSNNQIKAGAVMAYLTIAVNILAGLLYTPWMINQIGASDYGIYTLAMSQISIFALDFGLSSAVSRFLSKYRATNNDELEKKFMGIVLKLFLVIAVVLFIILLAIFLLIEGIFIELSYEEIEKLKVVFIIAGLFTVISFPFRPLNGLLISNERFAFIKFTDLAKKVLSVIFIITILFFGYGLYGLVLVDALVGLLIIIMKILYINKNIGFNIEWKAKDRTLKSEILSFSTWTTVIAIAQRFILNITPTILGALSGTIEIAIFSIGMTIEGYSYMLTHALGGLFLPKVTRIISSNSDSEVKINNLLIKVGRIQFFIAGLIVIGFITMGYEFIHLWVGQSFSNSYYIAVLLITPMIITLTQEIANTVLIVKNKLKYKAKSSLIVAIISVFLSLILSPLWGAVGAAFSIFIGNIIGQVIYLNFVYKNLLTIDINMFFRKCHKNMAVPFLLTLFIGLVMQQVITSGSLVIFVIKAIAISIIYTTLMWKISFNNFEKELIYKIIRNRRL
ncbi:MAG TPA: oligosaccharide flippase family protein [Gallicola sp.]|nr:oligosaccharide flippase family protein [Gallicola sp.]